MKGAYRLALLVALTCCSPTSRPPVGLEPAPSPGRDTNTSHRAAARARIATSGVDGLRVRILGTAQDGGFPHAACEKDRCQRVRTHPNDARHVASLGLIDPSSETRYLVDATPDIRAQLDLIDGESPTGQVNRAPVDGVLLTHAHIGHYLGLAFFGFEAVHTSALPVYASPSMSAFLGTHAPWEQLVRINNITLEPVVVAEPFELPGTPITATAVAVPHRHEYTDTLAWRFEGPRQTLLYIPDCDPWPRWSTDPLALFDGVTLALVDGTFFSMNELPGREVAKIGHPLMTQTMDLLQSRVDAGELTVRFVHLNHSNPAIDADTPQRAEVVARGFEVANDGQEFEL